MMNIDETFDVVTSNYVYHNIGLQRNKYSGHVQSVVTAEDLFQPTRT